MMWYDNPNALVAVSKGMLTVYLPQLHVPGIGTVFLPHLYYHFGKN